MVQFLLRFLKVNDLNIKKTKLDRLIKNIPVCTLTLTVVDIIPTKFFFDLIDAI
jgi:hypothetical protein